MYLTAANHLLVLSLALSLALVPCPCFGPGLRLGSPNSQTEVSHSCHLIISQEASLLGVLPWRCWSHSFCPQLILRGSEEVKSTSIGGEPHEELLRGGPKLSPVIHGICLQGGRTQPLLVTKSHWPGSGAHVWAA